MALAILNTAVPVCGNLVDIYHVRWNFHPQMTSMWLPGTAFIKPVQQLLDRDWSLLMHAEDNQMLWSFPVYSHNKTFILWNYYNNAPNKVQIKMYQFSSKVRLKQLPFMITACISTKSFWKSPMFPDDWVFPSLDHSYHTFHSKSALLMVRVHWQVCKIC